MRKGWLAVVVCAALHLAPAPPAEASMLIVYDGPAERSEAFKSARFLSALLEHFGPEPKRLETVGRLKPGEIGSADRLFIIFEEGAADFPEFFIPEVLSRRGLTVWIAMHIERLLDRSEGRYGISHVQFEEREDWRVRYKGREFPKEDPGFNLIKVHDGAPVRVLATAADGSGRAWPYALQSGPFWYFGDSPFSYAAEGGRFLILADLLHDILGRDHPASRRALVRIEDVTPDIKPRDIRRIEDFLRGAGVPFQISLIPIFRDPDSQTEFRLSDRPELASVLRRAQERGASIVLHGATHQHRGVSGDDYEFWNDISGVPIPHDTPDWVEQRLNQAFDECLKCGLYPLAWETPHYSAAKNDYRAFARFFNLFYDRVMAAELSGTQQIFPYPTPLPEYGVTVVPENLGYVDMDRPDPRPILRAAAAMETVRDGVASFFFHPFVPLKHLKTVVRGMKKTGWTFVSLRDFGGEWRTASAWATSAGGTGRITLADQYLRETTFGPRSVLRSSIGPDRADGAAERTVIVPRGSMFVLEALDALPPPSPKGFPGRVIGGLKGLFRKADKPAPLKLTRTAVITAPGLSVGAARGQDGFRSVLEVFGFHPEIFPAAGLRRGDLDRFALVVVPGGAAARLERSGLIALRDYVERGGCLVTDGRSTLAETLGIRFEGRTIQVREVRELTIPAPVLTWTPPAEVRPFFVDEATVLAKDASSPAPLAVIRPLGRGRLLYLGAEFDPHSSFGTSRFPYFPHYLKSGLGLPFNVRRDALEFYFDPGLHPATSWEKLVQRWKASGVRTIYLAAWHFYAAYQFDYRYFIGLCHDFGISVYAWFEYPQVTPLFWQEHPEWREKTADGRDARPHWRYLMNLADPAARRAALDFLRRLLQAYDWDGVNLAELNYDTNEGAKDPRQFTPMNDAVRAQYRARAGFDPREFFRAGSPRHWTRDPAAWADFLRFRTGLVRDLHADCLAAIEEVRRGKRQGFETIVTVMDSLLHPEIPEYCGVDSREIAALMDRFPFVLQVEDPARSWTAAPSRYRDLAAAYRPLVPDPARLMFDINCIDRTGTAQANLPSLSATGTELAMALYFASLTSGRAGIYSEATINAFDMDILPYVLGADVRIAASGDGYDVEAARPFTLLVSGRGVVAHVNGARWPFIGQRGLQMPSGRSRLAFTESGLLDPEALSNRLLLDADITALTVEPGAVLATYASPTPAALTFNRPPSGLELDGSKLEIPTDRNGIILPGGTHRLRIRSETPSERAVKIVGYFSSTVFYAVGFLSVLFLGGLYVVSRIRR